MGCYRQALVTSWFSVHPPKGTARPLVVEVPHAGLSVPPLFAPQLLASARAMARDADLYVDELYQDAPLEGAALLVSHVSRYVVDLNRAETDVDAESVSGAGSSQRAPRGVIWRLTTEGDRCLTAPLSPREFEARMRELHRPYHEALRGLIADAVARFGYCVLLAAHSMPSVARTGHADAGATRADVVPGTQGRTTASARVIDAVDEAAKAAGLTVLHDEPYRGGFTTRHYGRPRDQVHAIQVELSRRLYMDESTLAQKKDGFDHTRQFCRSVVRALAAVDLA